jgi:hypothetical protein
LVIQVCLLESLIPFCLGLNLLFFPADWRCPVDLLDQRDTSKICGTSWE